MKFETHQGAFGGHDLDYNTQRDDQRHQSHFSCYKIVLGVEVNIGISSGLHKARRSRTGHMSIL